VAGLAWRYFDLGASTRTEARRKLAADLHLVRDALVERAHFDAS
jgi:hypothetical protein